MLLYQQWNYGHKNRCTFNNLFHHVASLPWHMSSFCQRKPFFIRLSHKRAAARNFCGHLCCSIAAALKMYCTPCTPIWAHVSGLPLTSDDFAANSSIQRRGLSTSCVAIQIQVRPFCLTDLLRAHPLLARDILLYALLADISPEGSYEDLQTI